MKVRDTHRKSILIFIFISFVLYLLYYLVFGKPEVIIESFFLNIAFLPLLVLFTTFVLDELLKIREKPLLYRKKNTTIGLFYSEMGLFLLKLLSQSNKNTLRLSANLLFSEKWTSEDFIEAKTLTIATPFELVDSDFGPLSFFLNERRKFMLTLLQNPILAEDRSFNFLILSIFHLQQELFQRSSIGPLTPADIDHLTTDIERIYSSLIIEWLNYLENISKNYPHLYSLEVRTNPFKDL